MKRFIVTFVVALQAVHCLGTLSPWTVEVLREHEQDGVPIRKLWVRFADKGAHLQEAEALEAALEKVRQELHPKAFSRRLRHMEGAVVVEEDVEVHEPYVEAVVALGARVVHRTRWVNAVSVHVPNAVVVRQIAALPFVTHVDPVMRGRAKREASVEHLENEEQFYMHGGCENTRGWDYGPSCLQLEQINCIKAHDAGYNGTGVRILHMDSGTNELHPVLQQTNVLASRDFVDNDPHVSWQQGEDSGCMRRDHIDKHGTATLSVLAGRLDGVLYGCAPFAEILVARTEDDQNESSAEEDNYVAALEWGEILGAQMSTSSLGYEHWNGHSVLDGKTTIVTTAVNEFYKRGVLVVTSAGNEEDQGIGAPADAFNAISVGAVNYDMSVTYFSSRGPTADGRIKPELVGPGAQVVTALAPAGLTRMKGTSFSTPLVAGGLALVLQAHPDWTNAQVREAALISVADVPPNNWYGWGLFDAMKAINRSPFPADCPESCYHNDVRKGGCTSGACQCDEDHYGFACQYSKERCGSDWCRDSSTGTCGINSDVNNTLGFNKPMCVCDEGWTGVNCTKPADWSHYEGSWQYGDGRICHCYGVNKTRDPDCDDPNVSEFHCWNLDVSAVADKSQVQCITGGKCIVGTCGDLEIQSDESCDDGINNGVWGFCNENCTGPTAPRCGDGFKQASALEVCDDGRLNGMPGKCNTTCTGYVPPVSETDEPVCDGTCFSIEGTSFLCNDGPLNGAPGFCKADCSGWVPVCGDGLIEGGEVCDNGWENGLPGKCSRDCIVPNVSQGSRCGNYIVEPALNETCDNGPVVHPQSRCRASCTYCGDGVTDHQDGEKCDHGHLNGQPNHCDETCTYIVGHSYCGDGKTDNATETCDDGVLNGQEGYCNEFCNQTTTVCVCQPGDDVQACSATNNGIEYQGNQTCLDDCSGFGTCSIGQQMCGNGVTEGAEVCDGPLPICQDDSGEPQDCYSPCSVDNGVVEYFGEPTCREDCLGFGDCDIGSQACGNDVVEGTELCDGNAIVCTLDSGVNGTQACLDTCAGFEEECIPVPTLCNNGQVDEGEVCDSDVVDCSVMSDGSAGLEYSGNRTCLDDCSGYDTCDIGSQGCGNGVLEGSEVCDGDVQACTMPQGGTNGTRSCLSSCLGYEEECVALPAQCNNGVVEDGEVCDSDTNPCTLPVGAIVYTGNQNCLNDCTGYGECDIGEQSCGNGVLEGTETCDFSYAQACNVTETTSGTHLCFEDCTNFTDCVVEVVEEPVCGDGIVNGNEVCDSKNDVEECQVQPSFSGVMYNGTKACKADCSGFENECRTAASCGNGVMEGTEFCDEGSDNGKPGKCNSLCTANLPNSNADAVCGNGIVEAGEFCDDGFRNGSPGPFCSVFCDSVCGDSRVTGNEACDDGEELNGKPGHCSKNCYYRPNNTDGPEPAVCGNGELEVSELCDDGSRNGEEGYCNADCSGLTKPAPSPLGRPPPTSQPVPAPRPGPAPALTTHVGPSGNEGDEGDRLRSSDTPSARKKNLITVGSVFGAVLFVGGVYLVIGARRTSRNMQYHHV